MFLTKFTKRFSANDTHHTNLLNRATISIIWLVYRNTLSLVLVVLVEMRVLMGY